MTRRTCAFTQSEVTRAVKGAKAGGIPVGRIRILKDGSIEIDTAKEPNPQPAVGDDADAPITL